MVDVITTLTFELKYAPEKKGLRVVAELPKAAEELRDLLSTQLDARWTDGQHFEIEFQYARTVARHLKRIGVAEFEVRAADPRPPLNTVVEKAVVTAKARESWPVSTVEIVDERVEHVVDSDFENFELHGTYTARVTQVSAG